MSGEQYAIAAPRVGAGVEIISFAFPEAYRPRAQWLIDQASSGKPDVPKSVRIERTDTDTYIEWGASSHGAKPYFVYLRKRG